MVFTSSEFMLDITTFSLNCRKEILRSISPFGEEAVNLLNYSYEIQKMVDCFIDPTKQEKLRTILTVATRRVF